MILQYFKKKENEYKIKSDLIYLNILKKSKSLLNKKYFNEIDFGTSFELISILLIYNLKFFKNKDITSKKRVKEESKIKDDEMKNGKDGQDEKEGGQLGRLLSGLERGTANFQKRGASFLPRFYSKTYE